jgi:hypothetical protein
MTIDCQKPRTYFLSKKTGKAVQESAMTDPTMRSYYVETFVSADCGDAAHFHPIQSVALLKAAKPTPFCTVLPTTKGSERWLQQFII